MNFIFWKNNIDATQLEIEKRHKAIKELYTDSPFKGVSGISELKAKNLVLLDLFVQKDMKALGARAIYFQVIGIMLYGFTLLSFSFATIISFIKVMNKPNEHIINIQNSVYLIDWTVPIQGFITAFTFYGLLILLGVTSWKHGKAYFDQAERLYAKRRINRFLRLYIHLNDVELTLNDIKEIFNLVDNKNAFTDIVAEAKAPWGNAIDKLIDSNTEIIKNITPHTTDLSSRKSIFEKKFKK